MTLEFRQHGQRFFDRFLGRLQHASDPEVDDVQRIESEISKVIVHGIDQFLARKGMDPRFVFEPPRAHLGDDRQSRPIRMERLLDDLIGDMRTVKIAGIDMVDSCRHSFSQHCDCGVHIARRSPYLGTGKLHRAITHSLQIDRSAGERKTAAEFHLFRHLV